MVRRGRAAAVGSAAWMIVSLGRTVLDAHIDRVAAFAAAERGAFPRILRGRCAEARVRRTQQEVVAQMVCGERPFRPDEDHGRQDRRSWGV